MTEQPTYRDYVSDNSFMRKYTEYQQRYIKNMRESDKVLLSLIEDVVREQGESLSLLDIGCSTGNLLLHIKRAFPQLKLTGGDLMEGTIEQCQRNPDLKGIQFEIMDIVSLKAREHYDLITVNAVLYLFPEEKFASALSSIANALRAGGRLIAFDFFHSFRQELAICEKSASHPKGLMLHFRSYALVGRILAESGFSEYHFHPFHIPIDLERGKTYSDNKDGFEDLNSYTVRAEEGERLLFRGTLFQPWCHLVAQKS